MCRLLSSRSVRSSSKAPSYPGATKLPSRACSGRSRQARERVFRPADRARQDRRRCRQCPAAPREGHHPTAGRETHELHTVHPAPQPSRGAHPGPASIDRVPAPTSGVFRNSSRTDSRKLPSPAKNATSSCRLPISLASVEGAPSLRDSSRAPDPVTVKSITESRLPVDSPANVRTSSRLRRVAESMSMAALAWILTGGFRPGSLPR